MEEEKRKSSKSLKHKPKSKLSNNDKRFSYINQNHKKGLNGELTSNPNAFNAEEFLKLIEK